MSLFPVRVLGESILGEHPAVLVVQTEHQLQELGFLADRLAQLHVPVVVVVPEPPRKLFHRYRPGFRRLNQTLHMAAVCGRGPGGLLDAQPLIRDAGALVVMNDWGVPKGLVLEARRLGVPSIAWVEGVQDFADVDTGRDRFPYRTADHVLCLGPYDHGLLDGTPRTIVGSQRLQELWERRVSPMPEVPRAIANANFSYGVQTEHRRHWIGTVLKAADAAEIDLVVSRHPADNGFTGRRREVRQDVQELLLGSSVLVSRFSTLIYEALLMGVGAIYHNPHGEAVPTFSKPSGAYVATEDTESLVEALRAPAAERSEVRRRAEPFLRAHLRLDTLERPVDLAAQEVLKTMQR